MWKLIPAKYRMMILVTSIVLVFLFYSIIMESTFTRSISYSVTTITVAAFIMGKYLWKYVYVDFLKKTLCPDFNGVWEVVVESNFSNGTKVKVPVKIEADFFNIRMRTKTTVGRTFSNYCRVIRTEDDEFELEYMFTGKNDNPSVGDDTSYDGAARVRVINIDTMEMKGVFWTNRGWHEGNNTAGSICFEKSEKNFADLSAQRL